MSVKKETSAVQFHMIFFLIFWPKNSMSFPVFCRWFIFRFHQDCVHYKNECTSRQVLNSLHSCHIQQLTSILHYHGGPSTIIKKRELINYWRKDEQSILILWYLRVPFSHFCTIILLSRMVRLSCISAVTSKLDSSGWFVHRTILQWSIKMPRNCSFYSQH